MALNLAQFKLDLGTALKTAAAANDKDGVEKEAALQKMADEIAAAVDAYIKTATVSTSVSTTVTGTCVTPTGGGAGTIAGAGTGTGTGSLS